VDRSVDRSGSGDRSVDGGSPRFRLFCLPYAGGSASVYHRWPNLFPGDIEVRAVELPGRGHRMAEPPFLRMAPLVRALATSLEPLLDRPYAIFGHSMGGLIGFELVRALRARGKPMPAHLFVSAIAPPGTQPDLRPLSQAPDSEVLDELRRLNGTPRELLDNEELMALMLPVVRADFSVLEAYEYSPAAPLPVPITAFGGTADRVVAASALGGWRRQSAVSSRLHIFTGDHFFVNSAVTEVVQEITSTLEISIHTERLGASL